jgi:hypothetical protein
MPIRRRHVPIVLAATALITVVIPLAFAIAPRAFAEEAAGQPTASASVVKVENRKAARKKVVHRKFRLWARPTAGQVREIIRNEARRWGVPAASLSRRVACESRYHWWATNGQYSGVLQFSSNAFYRGMHTIKSRKVKIVRSKSRRVHDRRVTHFADGRKVSRRTTPRRQRLVVVYTGRIPRNPAISNTFAQIRIGAQAIRGISAVHSSEWACGA